jgi:hypothetical protein
MRPQPPARSAGRKARVSRIGASRSVVSVVDLVEQALRAGHPGGLHEDVDVADRLGDGVTQLPDRLEGVEVGGDRVQATVRCVEPLRRLVEGVLMSVREHDGRALREQELCGVPADAGVTAGHECGASGDSEVHDEPFEREFLIRTPRYGPDASSGQSMSGSLSSEIQSDAFWVDFSPAVVTSSVPS